jgi:predicted transcriptional regulator
VINAGKKLNMAKRDKDRLMSLMALFFIKERTFEEIKNAIFSNDFYTEKYIEILLEKNLINVSKTGYKITELGKEKIKGSKKDLWKAISK